MAGAAAGGAPRPGGGRRRGLSRRRGQAPRGSEGFPAQGDPAFSPVPQWGGEGPPIMPRYCRWAMIWRIFGIDSGNAVFT